MPRSFKCFSTKNFRFFPFGNSRFEHSVPKKLENVIITVVIVGLIFGKYNFSGKIFPNPADSETGC